MKRAKGIRTVSAACVFVAALFCTLLPAAPQEERPQGIWPDTAANRWVWVVPKADLAAAEVEGVFNRLVAEETAYLDSRFPVTVFFARKAQLVPGRAKKRKAYAGQAGKAADLRIAAEWRNGYLDQYRGQSYTSIPLDAVRGIDLQFSPRPRDLFPKAPEGRQWIVNILADARVSFFFALEDTARAFVSALASALAQRGLALAFSRSGLMWENVTAAQAADMGRKAGEGVLVTQVAAGGPGDRAGIRPLDLVLEFNGGKVRNFSHLALLLDGLAPGAKARLVLLRRLRPPERDAGACPWEPLSLEFEIQ